MRFSVIFQNRLLLRIATFVLLLLSFTILQFLSTGTSNDGGIYDFATDRWKTMSNWGAPSLRENPHIVWTGQEMAVWGGRKLWRSEHFRDGAIYDPRQDSWTAMESGEASSAGHDTVLLSSQQILDIEGEEQATAILEKISASLVVPNYSKSYIYSLSQHRWQEWPYSGKKLLYKKFYSGIRDTFHWYRGSEVWLGNRLLRWDNYQNAIYDPQTQKWQKVAFAQEFPQYGRAAWTGDKLIVWNPQGAAIYDPETNRWQSIPPVESIGPDFSVILWTGSRLLVCGGKSSDIEDAFYEEGALYDPQTRRWTLIEKQGAPLPRSGACEIWTGSHLLVWGGSSAVYDRQLGDGAIYDPHSNTWKAMAVENAPSQRSYPRAVWTGKQLLLWGGFSNNYIYRSDNVLFYITLIVTFLLCLDIMLGFRRRIQRGKGKISSYLAFFIASFLLTILVCTATIILGRFMVDSLFYWTSGEGALFFLAAWIFNSILWFIMAIVGAVVFARLRR